MKSKAVHLVQTRDWQLRFQVRCAVSDCFLAGFADPAKAEAYAKRQGYRITERRAEK